MENGRKSARALPNRRTWLGGAIALVSAVHPARAAQDDASVEQFIADECALAAAEDKKLIVTFFASWCSWCRRMDRFFENEEATRILEPHFRVAHVRALERRDEWRKQQMSGADEAIRRLSNVNPSLPFSAIMDLNAAVIATSISPDTGQNVGFPVEAWELNWFARMFSTAAPGLTEADRAALIRICVELMQ